MKIIDIQTPNELPSSWMLLQTATTLEDAITAYQARFSKKPKTLFRLPQKDGVLLYMSVET